MRAVKESGYEAFEKALIEAGVSPPSLEGAPVAAATIVDIGDQGREVVVRTSATDSVLAVPLGFPDSWAHEAGDVVGLTTEGGARAIVPIVTRVERLGSKVTFFAQGSDGRERPLAHRVTG
ncbi:MAG: hypothetical protein RL219_112 [Actinomycetota bacterium]|jgi:hypothetical protein